jgi:hypothetical protein
MAGYIYLNGRLVAEYKDDTTYFAHRDHLGSTRLLTRLGQIVCDSMDYLPFGEQIAGDTCTTASTGEPVRKTDALRIEMILPLNAAPTAGKAVPIPLGTNREAVHGGAASLPLSELRHAP